MINPILLERAVPLSIEILQGIESGAFKIFPGVIRNLKGQIVTHIANAPENVIEKVAKNTFSIENVSSSMQSHISTMQSQLTMFAGVNLLATAASTAIILNKLNAISSQLDKLSDQMRNIEDVLEFQELRSESRIKGQLKGAINHVIYAIENGSKETIRNAIGALSTEYMCAHQLVTDMLDKLSNQNFVKSINLFLSFLELTNAACFVLSQAHIKLLEDNEARKHTNTMSGLNGRVKEKLECLSKTHALGPNILSEESFQLLKSQGLLFKQDSNNILYLQNQNILANELNINQLELMENNSGEILMIEPIAS